MSVYKLIEAKNNRKLWYKNGSLCKSADVPQSVREQLLMDGVDMVEVEDKKPEVTESKPVEKVCIFCGKDGEYQRFVHLQTVYLCEEHWETKNVGKIGQQIMATRSNG